MVTRFLAAVAAVALLATPAAAAAHLLRGVALVIGETNYMRLPSLANPDGDARDIDHTLDELGFEVDRVLDATTADLRVQIDKFVADAKGADVALVYYAGHGIEAGGKDYLLGTDADISNSDAAAGTLIPLDDVMAKVQKAVPISVLLLDACRTDPFPIGQTLTMTSGGPPVTISRAGLEAVRGMMPANGAQSGLGMVVGFSASPGQSALDGPVGGNSPYATALLKHLSAAGYSFGDVMTLVSQEVYVETGARQLPWTSSSLQRVLYFGRSEPQPTGDDATILTDRRKLLLKIDAEPEESKAVVEAIATQENLKLADLYAMLDIIKQSKQAGTDDDNQNKLLGVARRVRETLDDPVLSAAPTDPELFRLDGLAQKALDGGDFALAYKYRQQEAQRAGQLEKTLDKQQAQINAEQAKLDQTRKELASVYARVAEAAMYTLHPEAEAAAYDKAGKVSKLLDPSVSLKFRLRAADIIVQNAMDHGDPQSYPKSLPIYEELLKEVDQTKNPKLWAQINARLAWARMWTADRNEDQAMRHQAVAAATAALKILSPTNGYDDWFKASWALSRSQILINDFPPALTAVQAWIDNMPQNKAPDLVQAEAQYANYWLVYGQYLSGSGLQYGRPYDYPPGAQQAFANAADAFAKAAALAKRVDRNALQEMLAQEGYTRIRASAAARDAAVMVAGVAVARDALAVPSNDSPFSLAYVRELVGRSLTIVGQSTGDQKMMQDALALFAKSEKTFTRDKSLGDWAFMREAEGVILVTIGKANKDRAMLQAAVKAFTDTMVADGQLGWGGDTAALEVSLAKQALVALDKPAASPAK